MSRPRRVEQDASAPARGNPFDLLGLWAFAVVQPLLDVLSGAPTFFVVRGSRPMDVFALLVALILVAPLPVMLLSQASRALGPRPHRTAHGALIGLLLAAILLVPLRLWLEPSAAAPIALALAGAGAGVWLYWRLSAVRQYVALLAVALPVFAAAFLLEPGIRKIAFPGQVAMEPVAATGTRTPVVLVVLDELPLLSLLDSRSLIDPIRYPNVAELAGQGTWYPRATAAADFTENSLPSILTGEYPDRERIAILGDYPRNFFTLFAASHDLQVMESLSKLCPPAHCADDSPGFGERMRGLASDLYYVYLHVLLPEPLTAGLPSVAQTWQDFGREAAGGKAKWKIDWRQRRALFAGDRAARFLRFIEGLRQGSRPPLIYLHSLLPHAPWTYLPSGVAYPSFGEPAWAAGRALWARDEAAVREAQLRHLLQVGYVDSLLGRLWQRLRELGLYEPSLIVLTADHGISFEPGRHRRRLTRNNGRDILGVPLIIKAPFQTEAAIDLRPFEAIDLLPTMAALLGVELPWEVDGRSALDPEAAASRRVTAMAGKARGEASLGFDPRFEYKEALERKVRLFGSGGEPLRRPPPEALRGLVGKPASALAGGAPSEVRLEFWLPASAFELEPEMRVVPVRLAGTASAGGRAVPAFDLAVAVNGTVRAITRVGDGGPERDEALWFFLLEETAFEPGPNTVEFLAVERRDGGWVLRPVGVDFAGG